MVPGYAYLKLPVKLWMIRLTMQIRECVLLNFLPQQNDRVDEVGFRALFSHVELLHEAQRLHAAVDPA